MEVDLLWWGVNQCRVTHSLSDSATPLPLFQPLIFFEIAVSSELVLTQCLLKADSDLRGQGIKRIWHWNCRPEWYSSSAVTAMPDRKPVAGCCYKQIYSNSGERILKSGTKDCFDPAWLFQRCDKSTAFYLTFCLYNQDLFHIFTQKNFYHEK